MPAELELPATGLSYHAYEVAVSANTVEVPFPYLAKAHVYLTVNDVLVSQASFTWTDDANFQVLTAFTVGDVVRVFRKTPSDELLVIFSAGPYDHADENMVHRQLLYIAQEAIDASTAFFTIIDEHPDLNIAYDLAVSVPYALDPNDYIAHWTLPAACSFDTSLLPRWSLTSWLAGQSDTCTVELWTRTDNPLVDGVKLATATLLTSATAGTWAANAANGTLLAQGTIVALKAVSTPDLGSFSTTVSIKRESPLS